MTATRITVLVLALVVGLSPAASAVAQTAKEQKRKQAVMREPARPTPLYRGTDKFRAGPLYHGTDYLGDDPDPFIRLQIQRDLSARYGGDD
jgi:hypothetical protein